MHPRDTSENLNAGHAAILRRAISRDLPVLELISRAGDISAGGGTDLARALYQAWIEHNGTDPLLAVVQFNYGTALLRDGALSQARDAFRAAIALRPDFVFAHRALAATLEAQGDAVRALVHWRAIADQLAAVNNDSVTDKTTALRQIARISDAEQDHEQAEDAIRQILELTPSRHDMELWIDPRQMRCKWPVIEPWANITRSALVGAMSPMTLARYADSPMLQLASAWLRHRRHAEQDGAPHTVGNWPPPETPRPGRLRIGYVSSDLYAHALGSLVVGVFALHDRTRFEVFAYYTGPDARGSIRSRAEASVDCWRDIAKLSDKQASAQIVGDEVDILIDLNGHTVGGRPGVFVSRPAPVIVNWLGYPGSMGTPHHQYIIADANIIPPHLEKYYSEAVRRLPCYQPNDREREVAGQTLSRAEVGLPEAAFVYCCFNVAGKITEPMFQNWMTILSRVPHAVLWLLSSDDATIPRLRRAAIQACVAPERLVFAAELPVHVHLTRYLLADLFLDTFPYGAHTTGSDALWMGLPVLTLTGRSFASRVCGSLVRSAGLAGMACETIEDYVQAAIRLGMDDAAMGLCRRRLRTARDECTLFNTQALVARLEALYDGMWNDHASGRTPVPDVTNLELYAEIGLEEQHQTVSDLSLDEYETFYRRALTYRDAVSPIPRDRRLWRGPREPVLGRPR